MHLVCFLNRCRQQNFQSYNEKYEKHQVTTLSYKAKLILMVVVEEKIAARKRPKEDIEKD